MTGLICQCLKGRMLRFYASDDSKKGTSQWRWQEKSCYYVFWLGCSLLPINSECTLTRRRKNNEKQAFFWMTNWNWLTQLKYSLLFHSKSEIHSVKRLQNQSQGSDSVQCNMGMFHMDCCSEATVTTWVSPNTLTFISMIPRHSHAPGHSLLAGFLTQHFDSGCWQITPVPWHKLV